MATLGMEESGCWGEVAIMGGGGGGGVGGIILHRLFVGGGKKGLCTNFMIKYCSR